MKRSKFSLSHYKLLTADVGKLYPISWYEALPGDTIQQRTNMLIRLSPMLSPVMHPLRVRVNSFFVPYRQIWDDFESFITGGEDGLDASVAPMFSKAAVTEGSLHDYLGVPDDAAYSPNLEFSALPARAYARIFNEYFRDEQLVTALTIDTTSGPDTTTNESIQLVSWEKDYFTAARPYEQLGTEVTIPLAGDAPVRGIGAQTQTYTSGPQTVYETGESASTSFADFKAIDHSVGNSAVHIEEDPDNAGYPGIFADLSAATGVSISDLRLYLALQRYKENRNEFGSRYVEYLRSLGVRSSDSRLQNPEFLSSARQTVSFSEVLSTDGANTGDMKGHGIAALRSSKYRRFFEEHGIVMTLMSVVPKAIYANGLHRSFSKTTKEDYFQKELAHVGDQAILNKETYTAHSAPDDTFGYQSIFDEYRSHPSMIHGEFRSTLNYWHYARIFSGDTALNSSFINCNPTKRQYADNGSDVLYVMANHSVQARRMLPAYPRKRIL